MINKKQIDDFIKYSKLLKKEFGDLSKIEINLSKVEKNYRINYLDHALIRYEAINENFLYELLDYANNKKLKKLQNEINDFIQRLHKTTSLFNEYEYNQTSNQLTIVVNPPNPSISLFSELKIHDSFYDDFWDYMDELMEDNIISFENGIRIGGKIILSNSKNPKKEIYEIFTQIKKRFGINIINHWEVFSRWFFYNKNGKLINISAERLRKDYWRYNES